MFETFVRVRTPLNHFEVGKVKDPLGEDRGEGVLKVPKKGGFSSPRRTTPKLEVFSTRLKGHDPYSKYSP